MAYPEKRKGRLTGRWMGEVDTRHKGGSRTRKAFPTLQEAERWEDTAKLTGSVPAAVPEAPSAPIGKTFREVAAEAKEAGGPNGVWKRDRDPSLMQRLDYCVGIIGDVPVRTATRKDLEKIVRSLERRPGRAKGSKISGDTINRYLTAASAVFTYAEEAEYREGSPKVPWQAKAPRKIHWLTNEQEADVVEAVLTQGLSKHAEDVALSIRVLARTGLRWGEYASLEPAQVSVRKLPDGTQAAWVTLWETKTDQPREVPIAVDLAAELLELLKGRGVPRYDIMRRALKSAVKACGGNPGLGVHALRHSTATRLVNRGVNLAIVQKFLGHSVIATTLIYTHVGDEQLRQAGEILSPQRGETGGNVVPMPQRAPKEVPGNAGDVEATAGIEPAYTVLQTEG